MHFYCSITISSLCDKNPLQAVPGISYSIFFFKIIKNTPFFPIGVFKFHTPEIGGELSSVTIARPRQALYSYRGRKVGFEGGPFSSPSPPEACFCWVFFCFLEPVSLVKLDFLFLVFSWITILSRDPNLLNFDLFKL